MSTSEIDVKPQNVQFEIVKIGISLDNFVLYAVDARATVRYLTANGITVKVESIYIPPEIYSQWGTDDTFIVDYVLQQIHFEKQ